MSLWRCGGGGEGGEEDEVIRGPAKLIAGAREPWVGLQVPGSWMRYMGNACTWVSRSRGRYADQSGFSDGGSD